MSEKYNEKKFIKITDDYNYNIITNKELEIIYEKITLLINEYFNKLIFPHKKIIIKYLYKLIVIFSMYYYNDNFITQLYLNNYQDIFSLLVLLMPFYDLNKSKEILSLDELFLNFDSKAKKLESSYYVDHLYLESYKNTDPDYLTKYFNSSLICISNTLDQMHCLILPNWCNIFPYTMETYRLSDLYKNFEYLYLKKKIVKTDLLSDLIKSDKHTDYDFKSETNFKLGFPILYGTVHSFLYLDIKNIKWMIYDLNIDNQQVLPNIIYLANKLNIYSIVSKPWDKLDTNEYTNLNNLWNDFINSPETNQISLKSVVLFYLRWEKDNNKLDSLNISKKCKEFIDSNLNNIYEENFTNEFINDDYIEFELYKNGDYMDKCLKKIYPNIKFENIYNYIYDCVHKFRYTWYGFCCLDDKKNILTINNFFEKYFLTNQVNINIEKIIPSNSSSNKYLYYITPKNIYNFCKSLIHFKNGDVYQTLSQEPKWNGMVFSTQQIFIERLNNNQIESWFNINNNLKKTYPELKKNVINEIMGEIILSFYKTNLFVNIIFQTLVYNGMLSYYKFNPTMTDSSIVPNKNTKYKEWETHIFQNIDIKSYSKSYHAFSNTLLDSHDPNPIKTIQTIIDSKWYTNFGANWIAQIQVYHHYNNNRVMFITGATGAGKSTVTPFLLVYAVKILNFNNNAKVVCTQPRTQPVKDNSEQISKSIGLPIIIKKQNNIENSN